MCFNILVLEDEKVHFEAYKQALVDDGLEKKYHLIHKTDKTAAMDLISNKKINAAIIDLSVPKVPDDTANAAEGIECAKFLLEKKQVPIVVVSGNLNALKNTYPTHPKHLKTFTRETGVHSKAFEYFEELEDLLEISPVISEAIKEIQPEIQFAFWNLWEGWTELNAHFNPKDVKNTKNFLKRYVCSHLLESWMENDLFQGMQHTEFYTYLPVKDRIHTGDILKLVDDEFWIVVTAPCDLSNKSSKYPDNLTLLKCKKIDENPKSEKKDYKEKVRKLFTQPHTSWHYLPPWKKGGKPAKVMFKDIKVVPFKEADREELKKQKITSLSFHFLPYLLQRYGAYVSRIGQADIDIDDYSTYITNISKQAQK